MTSAPSPFFPPAEAAVLLVLLPSGEARQARALTLLVLQELQPQLGAAIQVLQVDEGTHPAVVHSFNGGSLPAFVLTRHGVELWRQQGLPAGDGIATVLLSKLGPAI